MSTIQQNYSQFLLELLFEENKFTNPLDFLDKSNKSTIFVCLCVSLEIAQSLEQIKTNFMDQEKFTSIYLDLYTNAMSNYISIVGSNERQITFDEAKIFYPKNLNIFNKTNIPSVPENEEFVMKMLETTQNSYVIISRNENTFIVIRNENNDFIIIDPYCDYCGILSKNSIYKYITLNGLWDLQVTFLLPEMTAD